MCTQFLIIGTNFCIKSIIKYKVHSKNLQFADARITDDYNFYPETLKVKETEDFHNAIGQHKLLFMYFTKNHSKSPKNTSVLHPSKISNKNIQIVSHFDHFDSASSTVHTPITCNDNSQLIELLTSCDVKFHIGHVLFRVARSIKTSVRRQPQFRWQMFMFLSVCGTT